MRQTNTLIIGASMAGLASAAVLGKKGIGHIIIEKELQVGTLWRNHYDRLHLHTNKALSTLPYKKFDRTIPRYPSRLQVIDYLDDYQKEFKIHPLFNTKAESIRKEKGYWITETNNGVFQSKYLVIATGPFGKPKEVNFEGIGTFAGKMLHSCAYKTGRDFKEQKVLIVGFGNSACEIAMDLYEQGAIPSMAVRSPVNIIPRDLLGIPILRISLWMSRLPARLADTLDAPLMRLCFGDITRLGLKKKPYGAFEQIRKERRSPLLDIGTVGHIRQGHIRICDGIDHISGKTVHFADGKKDEFDAIVAAIGYDPGYAGILGIEEYRLEDLKLRIGKQKYFGKEGLYFCGFWIGPTGVIREISLDAQKIATDIAKKENQPAV